MKHNTPQLVFVSGASRGIGKGIADWFLERGYFVSYGYFKNKEFEEGFAGLVGRAFSGAGLAEAATLPLERVGVIEQTHRSIVTGVPTATVIVVDPASIPWLVGVVDHLAATGFVRNTIRVQ